MNFEFKFRQIIHVYLSVLLFSFFCSIMSAFSTSKIDLGASTIYTLRYDHFDPHQFLEKLTPDEQERFSGFGHMRRKCEFVATRLLRHDLFGFQHIHYTAEGAPYIPDGPFISISHAPNIVAIAVNKDHAIGLDLEPPRKDIHRVQHKFLSREELELFDCDAAEIVTRIWSAKEAMYKLAGRKKIIFAEELLLQPETAEIWTGRIINPDHELHVKLNIFDREGIIYTINTEAVERIENTLHENRK